MKLPNRKPQKTHEQKSVEGPGPSPGPIERTDPPAAGTVYSSGLPPKAFPRGDLFNES